MHKNNTFSETYLANLPKTSAQYYTSLSTSAASAHTNHMSQNHHIFTTVIVRNYNTPSEKTH